MPMPAITITITITITHAPPLESQGGVAPPRCTTYPEPLTPN